LDHFSVFFVNFNPRLHALRNSRVLLYLFTLHHFFVSQRHQLLVERELLINRFRECRLQLNEPNVSIVSLGLQRLNLFELGLDFVPESITLGHKGVNLRLGVLLN
jgi:hypothetical protein